MGLPTSTAQEFKRLADDKQKREERIREKTENLQELVIQLVAYKSLVEKNRERERYISPTKLAISHLDKKVDQATTPFSIFLMLLSIQKKG